VREGPSLHARCTTRGRRAASRERERPPLTRSRRRRPLTIESRRGRPLPTESRRGEGGEPPCIAVNERRELHRWR